MEGLTNQCVVLEFPLGLVGGARQITNNHGVQMRAAELLRENEKLLWAGVRRRRRMRRPHAKRGLKGVDFKPSGRRGTFTKIGVQFVRFC